MCNVWRVGADVSQAPSAGAFDALDESRVTRFQWKIMFISGMGFFTDAYDLFVIGIVVALLKTHWNLTTPQVSLLNSCYREIKGSDCRCGSDKGAR